ncbi:hypothetical protein BC828DRAFT_139627 [Blastocladiella britannica]|nr:hypothetical protein BC828DRAFT_139627 [Blastocladiella britannica]
MSSSSSFAPGKQCPELKDVATALKMGMPSSDCCKWGGITCNSDGYVTYMWWDSKRATGIIPESIQKLTSLVGLSLIGNQLTGSIPPALGQLTKLTVLVLDSNQLDGQIPESLGSLKSLTLLGLSYNQLDGKIPESLSSLKNLGALYDYSIPFLASCLVD